MKDWMIILIIIVSVIVLGGIIAFFAFSFGISSMMADKISKPKHFKTKEEKLEETSSIKDLDGVNEYQRTPIEFKMKDGYIIHADYSLNNKKKFVICLHGHISNREGLVKYAYAFYRLGYSLVFVDHRSHGENERGIITMGYQEHKDVLEIINQLKDKFGSDIEVGLFGCSMGGATALLCAEENQDLSFIVEDSAFAGLEEMVLGFIKIHHSPKWPILQITEMYFKKRYHFSYSDASPKDSLKNNKKVPILFIHGEKDPLVFVDNVYALYNNDNGPKRLEIFKEANHCGAVTVDKNRYYEVIEEFIKENARG